MDALPTLHSLLLNPLLLSLITPHLSPHDLLNLSLLSHAFHPLILKTPTVWRHLDLSSPLPSTSTTLSVTSFLSQKSSSSSSAGALHRYHLDPTALLATQYVLRDVRTLILDGLPFVTTDFLDTLLRSGPPKLQILSIRECPSINENQLMLLLQYLTRPSRAEGMPTVKGIYYFGSKDTSGGVAAMTGRFIQPGRLTNGWAAIVNACEDVIAFDTRICGSRRHQEEENAASRLASVRIEGCGRCGGDGGGNKGRVLVSPVPVLSSDIRVACHGGEGVLRCESCVRERWCEGCGKWWCEDCVDELRRTAGDKEKVRDNEGGKVLGKMGLRCEPCERIMVEKSRELSRAVWAVNLDCYECGAMCHECSAKTTRTCKSCRGEYCITHNEGADNTWCEWCKTPERRNRPTLSNTTNTISTTNRPQAPISQQVSRNTTQRERTMKRLNALRHFVVPTSGSVFLDQGMVIRRRRLLVGS